MRESVLALLDPVSLKISITGKYTASGFRFTEHTVLSAGIHLYRDINSKNISTVSLDINFTCIPIWYIHGGTQA